jgi:hypothetical protein
MLRHCAECRDPETKFDLSFNDESVCSACTAYKQRAEIGWAERSWEFASITANTELIMARHRAGVRRQGLDAAGAQVPLRVLAVTDGLSPIGCPNLDNISSGVDHIEAKTNPIVRRQIARYALRDIGDCNWGEHVTNTVPVSVRIAVEKQVKGCDNMDARCRPARRFPTRNVTA